MVADKMLALNYNAFVSECWDQQQQFSSSKMGLC